MVDMAEELSKSDRSNKGAIGAARAPVLILCLYIGNRNKVAVRVDEEILIHNISGDPISVFDQTL